MYETQQHHEARQVAEAYLAGTEPTQEGLHTLISGVSKAKDAIRHAPELVGDGIIAYIQGDARALAQAYKTLHDTLAKETQH